MTNVNDIFINYMDDSSGAILRAESGNCSSSYTGGHRAAWYNDCHFRVELPAGHLTEFSLGTKMSLTPSCLRHNINSYQI